jgi:hypothetical protein
MKRQHGSGPGDAEPLPGQGIRSLHSWQRLAAARRAIADDADAQRRLADDPAALLAQLGVDASFVDAFVRQQAEAEAPVDPPRDFAGRDLADEADDDDDDEPARGGCGSPRPPAESGPTDVVRNQGGRVKLKVL